MTNVPSRDEVAELITRLENDYDFQCEAEPLRNCVEWWRVIDILAALLARLSEVECERDALVAQRIEQGTSNAEVEGSSPSERATLPQMRQQQAQQIINTLTDSIKAANARLSEAEKALQEIEKPYDDPHWSGQMAFKAVAMELERRRYIACAALQYKDQQG